MMAIESLIVLLIRLAMLIIEILTILTSKILPVIL